MPTWENEQTPHRKVHGLTVMILGTLLCEATMLYTKLSCSLATDSNIIIEDSSIVLKLMTLLLH